MTEKRLDEMMNAYCDPETDAFAFKEKKHKGVKTASVLAAALVLVLLGVFFLPTMTGRKNSVVIEISAADTRAEDNQIGTIYCENTLYDSKMNPVDHYYMMDAELMLNGENIEDISFRSLNGFGRFFVWYNPDFASYHDDVGCWYDSQGVEDPFYTGWKTYDGGEIEEYHYHTRFADAGDNDSFWSREYHYRIQYIAVDDNDRFLQPDAADESRNDTIEITVTFSDGDMLTKRLSVTYPGGVMTVKEIGGSVES